FVRAREEGVFLECARVHDRDYYGTRRAPVEEKLRQGKFVLLNIDVQGAEQVRRLGLPVVSFFLTAPFEVLRQRIMKRGDAPEEMARRLRTAERELARAKEYDH